MATFVAAAANVFGDVSCVCVRVCVCLIHIYVLLKPFKPSICMYFYIQYYFIHSQRSRKEIYFIIC